MPADASPHASVLGVRVDGLRSAELTEAVDRFVKSKARALVLNVNVHCLNLAYENPWLKDLLNSAEIVFADGVGVILAARAHGETLPQRITCADWIWELSETAEREGHRLYFLGARQGVAGEAADRLRQRFPRLEIVGIQEGYFDKRPSSEDNRRVVEDINRLRPDILLVGFGMPIQERWLLDNWGDLRCGVGIAVGGLFDYVSGRLARPPRWMQRMGLEWLGRLMIEPRRLWRRYLIGNPVFLFRFLKEWWRPNGHPGGSRRQAPSREDKDKVPARKRRPKDPASTG
jgi:N-acetylglucosaminyldiphosphoundecaprenol N-acetyl-beta-D-mannosaminyltransferase